MLYELDNERTDGNIYLLIKFLRCLLALRNWSGMRVMRVMYIMEGKFT